MRRGRARARACSLARASCYLAAREASDTIALARSGQPPRKCPSPIGRWGKCIIAHHGSALRLRFRTKNQSVTTISADQADLRPTDRLELSSFARGVQFSVANAFDVLLGWYSSGGMDGRVASRRDDSGDGLGYRAGDLSVGRNVQSVEQGRRCQSHRVFQVRKSLEKSHQSDLVHA